MTWTGTTGGLVLVFRWAALEIAESVTAAGAHGLSFDSGPKGNTVTA
jgi:hypothetical protein